jgi:putative PEP-CTERM system TPR-repeat lipoprotein
MSWMHLPQDLLRKLSKLAFGLARGGVAAMLLSGIGLGLVWAQSDSKAAKFYEDALQRYEKNDINGAIVQLKNALQQDKNMLPVHVLLGKALLAKGDVVAAEVAFNEALRLGVNRAEVVVPLARAMAAQGKLQPLLDQARFSTAGLPSAVQAQLLLLRASAAADQGDTRTAMKFIEDARITDPGNPDSWLVETSVRMRMRQYKEAQAAADRAITLAPNLAQPLYMRATVAHAQGDVTTALALYGRALQQEPAHTEALVSRAGLLLDLRRRADATVDVAALLQSVPKDPRAHYLKALIAESEGDTVAAKAALNSITVLLDPVPIEQLRYRPQALMLGGLAHYGLNQYEKARAYLEAMQRLQPNSGGAKLLARIYMAEKSNEQAVSVLESYMLSNPRDAQALMLLASAHMAQGRHARATRLMEDALRTQDDPALRSMMGMSLLGAGRIADSIGALEAAYQKDPAQLQAGVALATMYMQGGQVDKAVRIASGLVRQRPDNPGLQYLLGIARLRQGDANAARTAFEAALKLDSRYVPPALGMASLDIDQGAYDKAAARLNALLAADDKNTEVLVELARLAERRGQLVDAQRFLEKAEDYADSTNLQPGLALVEFFLRNNKPDAAVEASKRLSAKSPDALPVLLIYARAQLANRDAVAAKSSLTRAATVAGYSASALLQVAVLQVSAGDLAGAAYSLEKALKERPDLLPAQALQAELDIRQGDLVKAEQRIRQIVTQHPKADIGYALQGDLALARGQTAAAVDAFRRAHQIAQSSASLLRLYQVLSLSDAKGAQQLADQWLKAHPQDLAVRRAAADGYARAGNLAAARSNYEALLKAAPDDAEALNNLANVLILTKDPAALAVAEKALSLQPTAPHIIGTSGWAAYKAGQSDRALRLLRDARLRDPGNPDTRYFLAVVLLSNGRTAEARDELDAALRGGTGFVTGPEAEKLRRTLR